MSGARFQAPKVPREGATALLAWETFEALCRVVWSRDDMCGLQFEEPISSTVIEESVEPASVREAAALDNIPLGRRRSLRSNAEDLSEPDTESPSEPSAEELSEPIVEAPPAQIAVVEPLAIDAPPIVLMTEPATKEKIGWMVVLPVHRRGGPFLRPETMSAAEQMFFLGAPLAHVVEYDRRPAD